MANRSFSIYQNVDFEEAGGNNSKCLTKVFDTPTRFLLHIDINIGQCIICWHSMNSGISWKNKFLISNNSQSIMFIHPVFSKRYSGKAQESTIALTIKTFNFSIQLRRLSSRHRVKKNHWGYCVDISQNVGLFLCQFKANIIILEFYVFKEYEWKLFLKDVVDPYGIYRIILQKIMFLHLKNT